jgi:hypothetical protein
VEADAKWIGFALLGLIILGFVADRVLRKRFRRPKIDLEAELGAEDPDEPVGPVHSADADV